MKILLLLSMACLLRQCHCGDEPTDTKPKGSEPEASGPSTDQQSTDEEDYSELFAALGWSEVDPLPEPLTPQVASTDTPKDELPSPFSEPSGTQDFMEEEMVPQLDVLPINTAQAEWETAKDVDEETILKDDVEGDEDARSPTPEEAMGLEAKPENPPDQGDDQNVEHSEDVSAEEKDDHYDVQITTEHEQRSEHSSEHLQTEVVRPKTLHASPGCTLDIAKLNPALCNLHEYYYDDNHIALITPKAGVFVTKIVQSRFPIWEAKPGESCEFSKLYLNKSNKPDLILVAKKDDSGLSAKWYAKYFGVWVKWKNPEERIDKLRISISRTINFIMNMEDTDDLPHCTIFETIIFGAPVRLYFAKPGYYSTEVINGDETIWKSSKKDERCVASDLYYTHDGPYLIIVSVRNEAGKSYVHFERRDGEWNEITETEFCKKREEITATHFTKRSSADIIITPPTSPPSSRHASVEYPQEEVSEAGATSAKGFGSIKKLWDDNKPDFRRLSKRFPSKETVATYVGKKVNSLERKMVSLRKPKRFSLKSIAWKRGEQVTQAEGATNAPEEDPSPKAIPSIDVILDISKPDVTTCHSHFHYGDSIPTMLVIPKDGHSIIKVEDGGKTVWEAQPGETLDYAKIYTNSQGRPELIFIMSSCSKSTEKKHFGLQDGRWTNCSATYTDRLNALRVNTETITNITIHLEDTTDTDQCTIFDAKICGVIFRSYIPRLGFYATRVSYGDQTIWSAADGETYMSSTSYLKDGEPFLLLLKTSGPGGKVQRCFERNEQGWYSIDKREFDRKRYGLAH